MQGDQFVLHALKFAKELKRRRDSSWPVEDVEPIETNTTVGETLMNEETMTDNNPA